MEGERWGGACVEFEKRVFQVVMESAELTMENVDWSGQFGCRTGEGRSEMEERDRSRMEEPEWMEELDDKEPMEDKRSCVLCVLGTEVEGPDRALGPLWIVRYHGIPSFARFPAQLPTESHSPCLRC